MARDTNGKAEKIIVMYADVRGSSSWTRRTEDSRARHDFWMRYDAEMLYFKERAKAPFYKRLGDGRMFVWPVANDEHEIRLAPLVLRESLRLYSKVCDLIGAQRSPRPPGIRIRKMGGIASKERYPDGEEDYLGYCLNTCHKLLLVEPQIGVVVHENVKEVITPQMALEHGLAFTKVQSKRCPDGVDRVDMGLLYSVTNRWKKT